MLSPPAPGAAARTVGVGIGVGVGDRERSALHALGAAVEDLGYRQLYAHGIGTGLFAGDRGAALVALDEWPEPERHALRLLGLGASADPDRLPPDLAPALDALAATGLVVAEDPWVRADGWVLVPALAGHLLTRPPPGYALAGVGEGAAGRAYLAPDSLRLAAALPSAAGRRVLDLGAGCGIQGLLAVPGAAEVVLVDVEADSLELAARNAVLNRVPYPVRVVEGDLYGPVAGEQFDLVVTLPPYVPTVAGGAQTSVTAGGADGLDLVRRIVTGAPDHLAPGGELIAVCQLLCRGPEPLLAGELATLAPGLDARLVVSDFHPLQPYLVDLATKLAVHGGADMAALVDAYRGSLRPTGATGVCTAVLRLRRPRPGEDVVPGCRVVGGRPVATDDVARCADGVAVGSDPSLRVAGAPGSPPVVLEGPTVALLEAFDGQRTIGEAAAAAWGRLQGADPCDVADQAVWRTDRLRRQGLAMLAPTGTAEGG